MGYFTLNCCPNSWYWTRFRSCIIAVASIFIIFSLSMYGDLSGVDKMLKETILDWGHLPLLISFLFVLTYVFFRKDKKNVEKTKQEKEKD